ncbi:MAG: EamA family transporter [Thermodesulfovibrionales bacterium]|nr:EamA family transporter [Thermodesulfovibrionales bacterium]
MLWAFLTLISAFTLATADALTKKALGEHDEYMVAWLRFALSLPLLVPLLFFIERPVLDAAFYRAFLIALPLEVLAIVLYTKALKLSPLSLSLPFLSLTPVFLVGFSYLILGERVSLSGAAGILLIAVGGYVLNLRHIGRGVLEPLKAAMRERGALLMTSVALIFCFTAPLGKMAIAHSSPVFFAVTYYIALTSAFFPLALLSARSQGKGFAGLLSEFRRPARAMLPVGIPTAVMAVSHMLAMSLTNVAYMIALKRTSLLFSVLYGHFLFREGHLRERFLGTSLMFAGFVIVGAAG